MPKSWYILSWTGVSSVAVSSFWHFVSEVPSSAGEDPARTSHNRGATDELLLPVYVMQMDGSQEEYMEITT